METLTIRKLDPEVKRELRIQAAEKGRSMEAEARAILTENLCQPKVDRESFGSLIRRHVEPVGGIELDLPSRSEARDLPNFE